MLVLNPQIIIFLLANKITHTVIKQVDLPYLNINNKQTNKKKYPAS